MRKGIRPRKVWIDEKGEMGVGTLLIFIAMILVAAIAAGILVQTAYELQQQAEVTGDQALKEVATGLKVIASYGLTDDTLTYITDLYIKVALTAGSPVINLYDLLIEISTGGADDSLSYSAVGSGLATFDVTEIRDTYPFNIWTATDVGITQGDIALLHIDLAAQIPSMELRTQADCQVLLIPKHGIPTYMMFTTPSVYSNLYEILA